MNQYIALALVLALVAPGVYSTTTSSAGVTSGSFAATPATVFDNTLTTGTDYAAWGSAYTTAWFGPGTTNTTNYVYAADITTAGVITKIMSRAINATLVSNGTAAGVADGKIGTDGTASISATMTSWKATVGLGYLAIAYSTATGVTQTGVTGHQNIYLVIVAGGASSVTSSAAIVSTASTSCTTTTAGTSYQYTIDSIFYENSTFYVTYTQSSLTFALDAGCPTTPPASSSPKNYIKTSVNGWSIASTPVAKWTTTPDIQTTAAGRTSTPGAMCGPSNYTNSTNIYCTYKSDSTTVATLNLVQIPTATGVAGSAATIATDAITSTVGNALYVQNTYTTAGFVYSQYQQGVLINNFTQSGATTVYVNNLQFYNTTSGATAVAGGVILGTTYTNALAGGQFGGAGIAYSQGYMILDQYSSTPATTANPFTPAVTTFEYSGWLANGTTNGTKTTIATVSAGKANIFADANGALWFGAYTFTYDETTSVTPVTLVKGTLGKVIAQIYYSAGNVLASAFAVLSVIVAALFAF